MLCRKMKKKKKKAYPLNFIVQQISDAFKSKLIYLLFTGRPVANLHIGDTLGSFHSFFYDRFVFLFFFYKHQTKMKLFIGPNHNIRNEILYSKWKFGIFCKCKANKTWQNTFHFCLHLIFVRKQFLFYHISHFSSFRHRLADWLCFYLRTVRSIYKR